MTGRVVAASGLAAAALWTAGLTAWGPLLHGGGHAHGAPALAAAAWLAGWALMATAMMLPAAPHKRRSLARCHGQRRLAEAASGDASGDAVRAGIGHGAATLRCCGPLMALMGLGLAGPAWMPLLGGVMAAEATTSSGARLRAPLGVILLLASPLVLWAGPPPG